MARQPILGLSRIIGIGPFKQGLFVICFTVLMTILFKLCGVSDEGLWRAATAGLGFYLLLNLNILFVRKSGFGRYIFSSFVVFVLVVAAIILIVQQVSGISIFDLYAERMIFFAVAAFYVVGTGLTFAGKALFQAWGIDEG